MTATNCLNCEKEISDSFCSGCGQKADTHRITFKNFLFHDVLHGTFHIEKGMLFTARQALFAPGRAALDYISGKRKRYYNVFYFILIAIGLNLFISHFHDLMEVGIGREIKPDPSYLNEASRRLADILDQSKIIICLFVPFAALNTRFLVRRKRLNLAEHCIISGMILLGISLISLIGNTVFLMNLFVEIRGVAATIYSFTVISLMLFHITFGYIAAFATEYSKWGMAFRIVLFFGLLAFEAWLLLLILIGIVTDWQFYTVNIVNLFG